MAEEPGVVIRHHAESDTLMAMFAEQQRFNQQIHDPALTEQDRVRWTKEYLLLLQDEFGEVLRELNWKVHRPATKPFVRSNLLEEIVDVYKYWLSLVTLWDFTPHEVAAEFWRKSAVVQQRFDQEQALAHTTDPIALVDIDGVLADYRQSFREFASAYLGRDVTLDDSAYHFTVPGLTTPELIRLKRAYRELGIKERIHVMPDAQSFLAWCREQGYFICVVTARPYTHYKRIFADTLSWFAQYQMPVDALVFEDDKQVFAYSLQEQGKTIAFAVEDHAGNANALAKLGFRVYLVNQPYNRYPVAMVDGAVFRVNAFKDIMTDAALGLVS